MADPSSEWGKELVKAVDRLDRDFLKFQTKINTLIAVFGSLGATALAVTAYMLLTLSGLQSSVAVLQSKAGEISQNVSAYPRANETLDQIVSQLKITNERLKNLPISPTPTPTPR